MIEDIFISLVIGFILGQETHKKGKLTLILVTLVTKPSTWISWKKAKAKTFPKICILLMKYVEIMI